MRETYYDEHCWSYLGRKTVCTGCENRQIGCHATCEAYIKEKEELKKERDSAKDNYQYTHAHQKKSMKAARRNAYVQKNKKGEH